MGLVVGTVFGLPVYTYGLVVLAAVLLGAGVAWGNVRLHHEPTGPLLDLLLWGLPLALVCGRLGFVLHHLDRYTSHLLDVFCVTQGGLSFYGGMLGFFLAVCAYSLIHGVSAWHWLDLLVPALLIALAVHELGIFGMQLTMGSPFPADMPNDHTLAEYIEYRYRPMGFENMLYFFPVALYQAGLQLALFLVIALVAFVDGRLLHRLQPGCLFLLGLGGAATIRLGCGFFYLHSDPGSVLPLGRLLSGGTLLVAAALFVYRSRVRQGLF